MTYIKNYLHHLFIDGINGMALGIFFTFVFGSILQQISNYIPATFNTIIYNIGTLLSALTCAGIGIGIAYKFNEGLWVTLSAAICGIAGGYASEILTSPIDSAAFLIFTTPGEPLAAFVAAYIGIEIGHLISGKTNLDFLLTPTLTIGSGVTAGLFLGPYISIGISKFGELITWGTQQNPFIMGIVVSVLMGMASTFPIHTVTLATALNLSGLAAGAAAVGCCCNMIGFAAASYHDNKIAGILSLGLGSSTLQLANILRKPIIWLPVLLSSAILGPISTMLFKMTNTTTGAGLGTLGLGGSITAWQTMTLNQNSTFVFIQILLMHFILPGILTLFFSNFMRKQNWIKQGDMMLDI